MYEVQIVTGFAAAHRLMHYKGKCEHLHGHNYRVEVTVRAAAPRSGGMVIDFGDLKKATNDVLDKLDHSYLNDIEPFTELDPSAENIAAYIFSEVAKNLGDAGGLLSSVAVWESDTSKATYIRDGAVRA
jgi:6-pyruvoyltetrahydropterin/6-carboxytetrahydropterin synthase